MTELHVHAAPRGEWREAPAEGAGLRVAHVAPMTLDVFGHADEDFGEGVTFFLSHIAETQARQGCRPTVHLLTSGRPHRRHVRGYDVVFHSCAQLPPGAPMRVRWARQLSASMVRAVDPAAADVVHFHGAGSLCAMLAAVAWRARRVGLPLVSHDQGIRPVRRPERAIHRAGLRRSSLVLAANPTNAQTLVARGAAPERVQVLPNGFDPRLFHPVAREGPARDVVRVLSVSRLCADKDPMTLAASMAELVRRGERVSLTLVGRGPMRASVEAALRDGGVSVRMIEHMPQRELVAHYHAADVLLVTSLGEGWNQSITEAMASGLPVIATDAAGTRDPSGDAGVLVPVGDPYAVADAVQRLTRDPDVWWSRRAAGLRRAEQLTWDRITARLLELYGALVGSRAGSAR